jgi:hypothetical protein
LIGAFLDEEKLKSFTDNSQQSENNLRINQTTTQILQLNFYRSGPSAPSPKAAPQNNNFLSLLLAARLASPISHSFDEASKMTFVII